VEFETALVVFAHPDDAEFLCGGTVARWSRDGTEVHYVCATDGSAGWNGPDLRDAADVLGVASVGFLGHVDGSVQVDLALRRDVCREVRRHRPEVLVAQDPSMLWAGRSYINHPDHRAVGEAVLAVVACDAPTRPQFPELLGEGFEPYEVPHLWLATDARESDIRVDIGETIDMKIKALKAHASQIENMGEFDPDERMRTWAAAEAKRDEFEYGEAFRVFDLTDED
jgi:LmbE family N-acetylglucosaminyl deacetylase